MFPSVLDAECFTWGWLHGNTALVATGVGSVSKTCEERHRHGQLVNHSARVPHLQKVSLGENPLGLGAQAMIGQR